MVSVTEILYYMDRNSPYMGLFDHRYFDIIVKIFKRVICNNCGKKVILTDSIGSICPKCSNNWISNDIYENVRKCIIENDFIIENEVETSNCINCNISIVFRFVINNIDNRKVYGIGHCGVYCDSESKQDWRYMFSKYTFRAIVFRRQRERDKIYKKWINAKELLQEINE